MNILDSKGPTGLHSSETWLLAAKAENAEKNADAAKGQARLAKRKFKLARRAFKLARRAAKRAKKEAEEAQNALAAALEQVARPQTGRGSARKPATARKRAALKTHTAGAGKKAPTASARKNISHPAGTPRARPSASKPARQFSGKKTTPTRGRQTVKSKPKVSKPHRQASKEAAAGTRMRKNLSPVIRKAKTALQTIPRKPGGLAPTDMPVETPAEATAPQTSGFERTAPTLESETPGTTGT